MPEPTLVGRSKQNLWPILVLLPAGIGLLYMAKVSGEPDFVAHGRSAGILNALGPDYAPWFFGAVALICLAIAVLALYRRLLPRDELILTNVSVTSRLFWGPGTIRWPDINKLEPRQNFLIIRGTDGNGKKKRLTVDLGGLDQPAQAVMAAIQARRPDLFR